MAKFIVEPGDEFVKTSTPPTRWVVERVFEYPDIPPHVRLIGVGEYRRTITVSISVLQDAKQFRKQERTA